MLKIKLTNFSLQKHLEQFLLSRLSDLISLEVPLSNWPMEKISLFRLSHLNTIIYRCAIAFQLARQSSLSPLDLAERIFRVLATQTDTLHESYQLSFTVKLVNPGWLDFQLEEQSLAIWLDVWGKLEWKLPNQLSISGDFDPLFPIEYAHARCCSLLRLGYREGIIELNTLTFNRHIYLWKAPDPVPWFNEELKQLRLIHPAERSLISQIMTTTDRLEHLSSENWLSLAVPLSQSFLNFERYCRIFGETAQQDLGLSQSRLGLIAITQYLLQGLWLSHKGKLPFVEL